VEVGSTTTFEEDGGASTAPVKERRGTAVIVMAADAGSAVPLACIKEDRSAEDAIAPAFPVTELYPGGLQSQEPARSVLLHWYRSEIATSNNIPHVFAGAVWVGRAISILSKEEHSTAHWVPVSFQVDESKSSG